MVELAPSNQQVSGLNNVYPRLASFYLLSFVNLNQVRKKRSTLNTMKVSLEKML